MYITTVMPGFHDRWHGLWCSITQYDKPRNGCLYNNYQFLVPESKETFHASNAGSRDKPSNVLWDLI